MVIKGDNKPKKYVLWTLLVIVALFTTGTRSLIVGVLAGICVFLFLDCVIHKWDRQIVKKLAVKVVLILVFAVMADKIFFRGMNVARLGASFSVSSEVLEQGQATGLVWTSSEYSVESEQRGTANSNTTRLLQIKDLARKFIEHPWFGHGFTLTGYDMQGVSYIAKVGLVGVILWCVFLWILLCRAIRMEKQERGSAQPAIYLVIAVLMDVMLQSMFGSLTMAMAVFLFLDLEYKEFCLRGMTDKTL